MMRDQLLDFLKKELIGPDPVPPLIQKNGEEIIKEPPRLRYGAGILFPQSAPVEKIDASDEIEAKILNESADSGEDDEKPPVVIKGEEHVVGGGDDDNDFGDQTLNLANALLPSAVGCSCFLDIPANGFLVKISAARYHHGEIIENNKEGEPVTKKAYFREPLNTEILISKSELPDKQGRSRVFEIQKDDKATGLVLNIRNRTTKIKFGDKNQLYTFSLVNTLRLSGNYIVNDNCFFQVDFSVRAQDGSSCFLPYPSKKSISPNEDDKSMRLLYRNHRTFAVGHGCATSWIETKYGRASEIRSDILPSFDTKPVLPKQFDDLKLKMYDLSDCAEPHSITSNLSQLCQRYEQWIEEQENQIVAKITEKELKETAFHHIENCRKCLNRMRKGIDLIENDVQVRQAFMLMNRAMLMQQLRYGLKLREWKLKRDKSLEVEKIRYPDIHDSRTWPDWSDEEERNLKFGLWRPFQIAFILMNIKSMARLEDDERKIVDLIWFPTGGGKTEAYLGLSAFTIFLKRLRNKNDSGTTVLMRYTLRLLTAQQYQRAASLICACESIRKENEDKLGRERITIGLWVGESLTPNKRADAVAAFNRMEGGSSKENPFIILKCPWCGVQMGLVKSTGKIAIKGYRKIRRPSSIIFRCDNPDCDFSTEDFCLPLLVIDEDIYEFPPALLIGTVDKFAMLPWRPDARSLFGLKEGTRITPPELIIQDELHLISGPLGSMVGYYETLINEFCTDRSKEPSIGPKIITSTATISRAKEQIHSLYNCSKENVFLFPPPGIDAGDSFFAYEATEENGRMYVGVHASGLPSHATAQVRVISALLQGTKSATVKDEQERDPYWTIINYFNSLRELGHALTLIRADIREYLNAMYDRKHIHKAGNFDPRRFINRPIELTSRISSTEIPQYLQELEISYPGDEAVDICQATNMISVGVDVQRLGLMAVTGQPKTTSEYIQATSRVGRSKNGPGLIVIVYNPAKPRDRSHYEHFRSYHATIYSQVEPTSVTPFSAPVRERALHALLITLIRYLGNPANRRSPQPLPSREIFEKAKRIIEHRVSGVDPDELELTVKLFEERVDEWSLYLPPKFGDFAPPTEELPLMYPAGNIPHKKWGGKSWATPTSMRNVDATCEATVIGRYLLEEE